MPTALGAFRMTVRLIAMGPARTHVAHRWTPTGFAVCGREVTWGTFVTGRRHRLCKGCA